MNKTEVVNKQTSGPADESVIALQMVKVSERIHSNSVDEFFLNL